MTSYFIRRFLLIVPTFLGITVLVFFVMQMVPGGPLEQELLRMQMGLMQSGETAGAAGDAAGQGQIPAAAMEEMERFYGFDKPIPIRYLRWLGFWPREEDAVTMAPNEWKEMQKGIQVRAVPAGDDEFELEWKLDELREKWEVVGVAAPAAGERDSTIIAAWLKFAGTWVKRYEDSTRLAPGEWAPVAEKVLARPVRDETGAWTLELDADKAIDRWQITEVKPADEESPEPRLTVAWTRFSGLFTGNFGSSYVYAEPVWDVIKQRFPISIYFGLIGFLLSYTVCIPLGVFKAIKHGSRFDFASSSIVFLGYSIPGWALGALLLVLMGGGSYWDLVPLGGFRSVGWEDFPWWKKVTDQLHHTILPVLSYAVTSFATLTVLMKNSLMENLGQDYVRTAFAKGLSEKRVIFLHAFRNSLIPIATGLGHLIGIVLMGSYLIEKVFNINGFGMLGFTSIVKRDYPVVLGILLFASILRLLGNIISDILYAVIDPRIRFK